MMKIMMWQDFIVAFALLLVFEGILPFLKPAGWRNVMNVIAKQPDKSLRAMGLTSMLMGVVLLYMVR